MTEAEWLVCEDPSPMLHDLWGSTSERKLRFFLFACLLRAGRMGEQFTQILAMGERLAEGLASEEDRRNAFPWVADDPRVGFHPSEAAIVSQLTASWLVWGAEQAARGAAFSYVPFVPDSTWDEARWEISFKAERGKQCDFLRDIFGNPLRPVTFYPEWRTDTATAIARQMYESRDFSVMPILADALQDAGCDSADILNHGRGAGPHVRGCWVVDAVLNKG